MSAGLIRVVHIITKLELGGAQQNTLYTLAHLNRSVFEPVLICGEGGILDEEARQLQGVTVHFCASLVREIRPVQDLRTRKLLKDLLLHLQPNIVHTHSSKAGILGRAAAKEASVPVVLHTFHGFGFHRYQNPLVFHAYLSAERRAAQNCHHMIFVSHDNWKWADELGLTKHSTASLIRSGVEVAPLLSATRDDALRARWGLSPTDRAVGMIACLKEQKDPLSFVEIADRVTQQLPDIHFVLAGDGELAKAVMQRAAKMKHPDRFHHLGWVRNTAEFLAQLDLAVLTSLWEGLPRVIPECTIAGLPIIASNIEGNREVIREGKNGFLAQPRDVADFTAKIVKMLEHRAKVDSELGKEFKHEFDIDRMVRKQEELYCKLSSYAAV